jgi:hypothetical protein
VKTITDKEVGGYLHVSADLDAPAQSVGGFLDVNADLDAPALQSVGGYLYVVQTSTRLHCNQSAALCM